MWYHNCNRKLLERQCNSYSIFWYQRATSSVRLLQHASQEHTRFGVRDALYEVKTYTYMHTHACAVAVTAVAHALREYTTVILTDLCY